MNDGLRNRDRAAWCFVAVLMVAGCTTHRLPVENEGIVFHKPEAACHAAALDALATLGFDVRSDQPEHIEGVRPRRMNLVWGSPGGEHVIVWLMPEGPDQTRMRVRTKKTFVGGAAQKNFDKDMEQQLTQSLGR